VAVAVHTAVAGLEALAEVMLEDLQMCLTEQLHRLD
jgi:hypothetical protein